MAARTEKEKMLAGELYRGDDPELSADRARCRELLRALRTEPQSHDALLTQLLAHLGTGATIEAPFACDYGYNIRLGENAFVNFNAVFLDCAAITIGDRAQIGPAVQLLTADHPLDPQARREGLECASPIAIGADTWVGGGAIVLPGRTIGERSVIGAGSVVTRDIPAGVVAVGNPCRPIKTL
jgi:maltose O-acetyltransferase